MLIAEARVETGRASRYLTQLCQHLSQLGPHYSPFLHGHHRPPKVQDLQWTDTGGEMRFENGRCTLEAQDDALLLRLTADDEASLDALQRAIAHRVATIGRREKLTVQWRLSSAD